MANRSLYAILSCAGVLLYTAFIYYPKWQNTGTESTMSWDVSGYYYYLPATFIYKDLKKLGFKDSIEAKYRHTTSFYQAFVHPKSGNYVMKYSSGQAVMFAPFFALAHLYALQSDYPADGFSQPYRVGISIGSMLIALIGLWFLRKILLAYFSDGVAALAIVAVTILTNYLNYASIDAPQTHSTLFTVYTILIWLTIQFYRTPPTTSAQAQLRRALGIGGLVGLATLTRPTEIISCLIPLLWGVSRLSELPERARFILTHFKLYFPAVFLAGAVMFIQPLYWHFVSGEWLVYSYGEQGFNWLRPHIRECLISYRAGWLVYSPIMVLSLVGFYFLKRYQPSVFWASLIFSILFMYITFAWNEWWYGGSLGQRAMVQCYPILSFPMAAFVQFVLKKRWLPWLMYALFAFMFYYSAWLVHISHKGGGFYAGMMTGPYFWKILFKTQKSIPPDAVRLLDAKEEFIGERKNIRVVFKNDFEQDTTSSCSEVINGKRSLCLTLQNLQSPRYRLPLSNKDVQWVRAGATFRAAQLEPDIWHNTILFVRFFNGKKFIKETGLRVQRFMKAGEPSFQYVDAKAPRKAFDTVEVYIWNCDSPIPTIVDDLIIETYTPQ